MMIDAHQHFWNPARGDYDWMPMDNAVLARQYAPADLTPHLKKHGIKATVMVQAAATIEETEYMLGIADATPSVAGVVGWIDFEKREHLAHLKRLANHPKFLGVRPMIQDLPDVNWMLREDVQWGFEAVSDLGLTFDALGFPQHLENFLTILKRYSDMRVVVDHCMKPQIRDHSLENLAFWADGMAKIAAETNACCKFSALVTEAKPDWTLANLRPYSDHLFEVFGAQRMMWGSDWPVCQLAATYDEWREAAIDLTSHLDEDGRKAVFGGTAKAFYRLAV